MAISSTSFMITSDPHSLRTSRKTQGAAIRASVMKRFVVPLILGIGILCSSGYFDMYAYYRFINPDAVINRIHVRDPGFAYGMTIADSFCGESIVSKLAGWTGRSIAPTVNQLYAPLAALDQAINGRSIRFADAPGKPIFSPDGAKNSTHTIEIDPADLK